MGDKLNVMLGIPYHEKAKMFEVMELTCGEMGMEQKYLVMAYYHDLMTVRSKGKRGAEGLEMIKTTILKAKKPVVK
jgi:hypothetical protein